MFFVGPKLPDPFVSTDGPIFAGDQQREDPASPTNGPSPGANLGSIAADGKLGGLAERRTSRSQSIREYLQVHVLTSRADFRLSKLKEKLQAERFILKCHLRAFFRRLETAAGLRKVGNGPDRKTINTLIENLKLNHDAKVITVSILTKSGATQRLVDVILRNDVAVTEELLRDINKSYWVYERVSRQQSHIKVTANVMEARGEEIPVMDEIERLRAPEGSGQAAPHQGSVYNPKLEPERTFFTQMQDNGFIPAKMVRVKLLHYLICRMVGLGGFERPADDGQPPPVGDLPAWQDRGDVCRAYHSPSSEKFVFPSATTACATAQVHIHPWVLLSVKKTKHAFSPRQLWEFMPIDLFMQIVGTCMKFEGIKELCGQSKMMCQIPEEKQQEVIDSKSRKRLSELLDILCRMNIIESIVAASTSCLGLQECSRFVAHEKGDEASCFAVNGGWFILSTLHAVVCVRILVARKKASMSHPNLIQ